MSRTEKTAEAVVAEPKPARAARPDGAGNLRQSEGPNERESDTPASLTGARRQKPRQLGLVLDPRGEAPEDQRSGEAPTAANGNGRSGTDRLMEEVVERANAKRALKRVRQNKGSPGSDGMTVEELPAYLAQHWVELRAQLLAGTYQPALVRRQAIPKAGGGVRELGIPTVLDRFVQQAILQVLQPRFDPTFSQHSYGFRPGRRAHEAVCAAQRYIQEGRQWVVDVDLERFFDRVNHDVLMGRLAKRVADQRLLGLIRRYLEAGVMAHGVVVERHEGTPQGGPLSPILANVLLDEVDRALEKRGHAFARYADDCNVYVRSRRAGERVMTALHRLYARLRLRVNEAKSAVARPWSRKFLGYSFWVAPGQVVKRRVAAKALVAMKDRVREITARNRGRSTQQVIAELRGYLVGWREYFRLAETPSVMRDLDGWIRHRLRALQLKQWKRGRTVFAALRARGLSRRAAAAVAANARRWWWNSGTTTHTALPSAYFDGLGVPRLAC
jgi:RNA-directed DNA polymerase